METLSSPQQIQDATEAVTAAAKQAITTFFEMNGEGFNENDLILAVYEAVKERVQQFPADCPVCFGQGYTVRMATRDIPMGKQFIRGIDFCVQCERGRKMKLDFAVPMPMML